MRALALLLACLDELYTFCTNLALKCGRFGTTPMRGSLRQISSEARPDLVKHDKGQVHEEPEWDPSANNFNVNNVDTWMTY